MSNESKILIGKIVAAQGLDGSVRVQTFTTTPTDLTDLKIQDIDLTFVRVAAPNVAICRVRGVNSRTSAEALRGTELFVLRENLPPLPDGQYYQTDLIGMTVYQNADVIGVVVEIHNFGAGDILEIENGEMISFENADVDTINKKINLN